MGNDFIERVVKKCEESQKILGAEKKCDQEDMKFVLKNNFGVVIGRSTLEESAKSSKH